MSLFLLSCWCVSVPPTRTELWLQRGALTRGAGWGNGRAAHRSYEDSLYLWAKTRDSGTAASGRAVKWHGARVTVFPLRCWTITASLSPYMPSLRILMQIKFHSLMTTIRAVRGRRWKRGFVWNRIIVEERWKGDLVGRREDDLYRDLQLTNAHNLVDFYIICGYRFTFSSDRLVKVVL